MSRSTERSKEAYRRKVGQRLRQARETCGLTTAELAVRLGMKGDKRRLVNAWEAGTKLPRIESWPLLSRELGRSLDWLLGARESDVVPARLFSRTSEVEYLRKVEEWEEKLVAHRRTSPPLFDSWVLLPEVMAHQYKLRRGLRLDAEGQRLHAARAKARWRRFEAATWTVWELCPMNEVLAFVRREGPYVELAPDLVRRQLEAVLEKVTDWSGRYLLAFTPLTFRFAYRIYDSDFAVFNSMMNYIVVEDRLLVEPLIKEFQSAWGYEENELNAIKFLRRALDIVPKRLRSRSAARISAR